MRNNTNNGGALAGEDLQKQVFTFFLLGLVVTAIATIGVYYGYVHYLKLSWEWAGILTGSIGASITYLFFEKQNVFKKIFYILLLMWVLGYTGITMLRVGIIS